MFSVCWTQDLGLPHLSGLSTTRVSVDPSNGLPVVEFHTESIPDGASWLLAERHLMPKTRWTVDHMSETDASNPSTGRLVPSASLISGGLSLDQQRTSEELPGYLPEMRLGYQPNHNRH